MIKTSFKNPYLVLVFSIIVAVIAGVLIPRMPVDILPQFKKSAMQIITLYPGMPAEVVEKDITSRMERWTGQSPGIEKQLSKSIMGVSVVTNFYGEDVEPAEAMANTSSYAVSDMYYQPPGTMPPMIQPFDPTASKPLMLLTVSSDVKSGKELYDVAYLNLRQMLSGVEGIVAPAAYGGSLRMIYVYVDPLKMEALGISQTEVSDAIQKNTTMIPSGIAQIGTISYGVDAKGLIVDVKDFDDIVITHKNGKPIFIKDIGQTKDASAIQTNIARVDGKQQVYLPIFKRPGANTIAAVEAVKAALPSLKERMPKDVKLNVIFDQSSYVKNAISGLENAGLGGLILVVIILVLFLGNFKSALIVAISLPLSVLFAFIVLSISGQAINSITLGGLALVLGLLVDNSIVVLENIDKHLKMGKSSFAAAKDAALEVANPVLASTLVIIVVFFPVFFLTGITKFLFSPLAITVAGAMIGSYLFALTLIPLMAAFFFRNQLPKSDEKPKKNFLGKFQRYIDRLGGKYQNSLPTVLKFRVPILAITIVLFMLSIFILKNTGYELFPQSDVGQMEIMVRMESGTTLQNTNATIAKMEQVIRKETADDLEQIIGNVGVFYDLPAAYTPNSGTQDAFIGVQLKESHQTSTFEYARRLRKLFHEKFPGVEVSFNTGGMITAALNEGKPAPIDIQVKGNDLKVLRQLAENIRDTVAALSATRDVRVLQRLDQPAKNIDIDRIKAASLGIEPVDAIKNMVSALNSSVTFNKSFWIDERNGNHYYVGVTYPESEINNQFVLENVGVGSSLQDKTIPFRNFAKITDGSNPVEINHHKLSREFNVYANVEGKDVGSVSDEIQEIISNMQVPSGYEINFQGEVAIIKESFSGLGMGLALAVILAFLIITPLFRSFRKPLIIILSFPFGIIGVAFLMWITGTYMSIQAIMGIIMMVGISVSYGNILVDRINALLIEGKSKQEAIIEGSSDRFRPVLMTASTTILGLLPTALATNPGSEANVPLAIVVIGGTFMAMLITLYIIPIFYSLIAKK
ncbi:efflux RND transporter permease subunit [Flavobacterium cellulosilyticum]|uniref:Efflux RND transporter permease subunit n=1 Tax=Flavobacterium cellulosilyticum TaxID=2541731 RepID=A0A4V2YZ36_9FLAO|nr:efflux RND transporter permease subunit [Flavobacterium cellulosilyticum]TDD95487.1 efflux RND transporter permease subunit [Flavobacterium cellulosilyticum]